MVCPPVRPQLELRGRLQPAGRAVRSSEKGKRSEPAALKVNVIVLWPGFHSEGLFTTQRAKKFLQSLHVFSVRRKGPGSIATGHFEEGVSQKRTYIETGIPAGCVKYPRGRKNGACPS